MTCTVRPLPPLVEASASETSKLAGIRGPTAPGGERPEPDSAGETGLDQVGAPDATAEAPAAVVGGRARGLDLAEFSHAELLRTLAGERGPAAGQMMGPSLARGLVWLSRATPQELRCSQGWSSEAAVRVWAAFELGRRAEEARVPPGSSITGAASAAAALAPLLRGRRQECLALGLLDARHRLLSALVVGQGTLDRSLVHPREIFGPALREGAAAVLCAHNHPSGDPEPSAQDWSVTRRLRSAGELLGIPLVDHLVIGAGCWVSLRASGPDGLFSGSASSEGAVGAGWGDSSPGSWKRV